MTQSDVNPEEVDVLRPITSKSVLIEEPEPLQDAESSSSTGLHRSRGSSSTSIRPRRHHTKTSKRLAGRSARSIGSEMSAPALKSMSGTSSDACPSSDTASTVGAAAQRHSHHHVRRPHNANHIISQITGWLHQEKAKQAARRSAKRRGSPRHRGEVKEPASDALKKNRKDHALAQSKRDSSEDSDTTIALAELERILTTSSINSGDDAPPASGKHKHAWGLHRHRSHKSSRLLRKKMSVGGISDSEARDDEEVPSAEVTLDNSRAFATSGRRTPGAEDPWLHFKREIVRLTHTLQIRGWRRIPIEDGSVIEVERLSGALTNAVYVVSPPPPEGKASESKKKAKKLLLRIYGPQVEHLIDRDNELMILRRLAQKQIGPILLGTFTNGRFELYFEARTLTPKDLRQPPISEQIAKRMRELHDGIELLPAEREAGAFVWQNWDKWKERCEEVITWLDEEITAGNQGPAQSQGDQWKKRGLVCGVEWYVFRQAVRQYRDWLAGKYGGEERIKEELVFAHNDTQYGNLLRMDPSGESPLLLPQNEHKRLKVIDFEYANANVAGLEFANHFTEWCYDYHDADQSYALHETWYPTVEEQRRFVRAYVQHTPPIQLRRPTISRGASSTTTLGGGIGGGGSTNSLSQFILDSRGGGAGAPSTSSSSYLEQERQREEGVEAEMERLLQETRLWRMANSAQWVAWGIVQAKVSGMEEALAARKRQKDVTGGSGLGEVNGIGGGMKDDEDEELDDDDDEDVGDGDGDGDDRRSEKEKKKKKQGKGKALVEADGKDDANADADAKGDDGNGNGTDGTDDDDEEAFDYLAYAQERALLFWGDALQVGIVRQEELPEELLQKVKKVAY